MIAVAACPARVKWVLSWIQILSGSHGRPSRSAIATAATGVAGGGAGRTTPSSPKTRRRLDGEAQNRRV